MTRQSPPIVPERGVPLTAETVVVPVEPTREMWAAGGTAACQAANQPHDKVVEGVWSAMLSAAPAREPEGGAVLDPQSVTLEWVKVETRALEEWRAEFGDYVALVTLGHDNVWAHRVNNSGRLHYKTADEAKAAALADLQGRLSIRLHAARKTVALYDAALTPKEAPAATGAGEAIEQIIYEAFGLGHHSDAAQEATGRIVDYLRAQPQAREEAKAVGWVSGSTAALLLSGALGGYTIWANPTDRKSVALYLSPPSQPLAEGAEKLREAVEAWDELAKRTNLEISFSGFDEEDGWSVHRVTGGVNDREWEELSRADTPLEAVNQVLAALKAEAK